MKKFPKLKINPNFLVFALGMAMFFFGIFRIYPPAAFAITGLILMCISLFGNENKKEGPK